MMVREALDDTVLTHVGPQNLPAETVVVEKGTLVVVDAIGLRKFSLISLRKHLLAYLTLDYNPRIFPEPEAYKPERWYGIHDNDMTMFSTGSRACEPFSTRTEMFRCLLSYRITQVSVDVLH